MAEAVRAVVTLLDPDRIVVGGGVVDHTPLYERLEAALEPDIAALLHRSTHGRFAGALGAALWAQQNPGTRSRGQRTIAVVNGPNLDQLGRREPEVYGTHTLADLERACYAAAEEVGCGLLTFQSNAESALIEWIWSHASQLDGLVLNPAGLTAHGRALRDAVIGVGLPFVEVHLTNIDSRGPIHRESCFADAALGRVYGFGIHGYGLAIQGLARLESGTD
jgi:3-dehydroquinate dehydratase-2